MSDEEPTVTLCDGTVVLGAIYDWCRDLLDRGHTIDVTAEGDVHVQPACPADLHYCLAAPGVTRRPVWTN